MKRLSQREVLETLPVSRTTIWRMRKRGALKAIRPNGGKLYFTSEDIEAMEEKNRTNRT